MSTIVHQVHIVPLVIAGLVFFAAWFIIIFNRAAKNLDYLRDQERKSIDD